MAGSLPATGTWLYDTPSSKAGNTTFQAYVNVEPAASDIYAFNGILLGGRCRKGGHSRPAGSIGYSAAKTKKISVGPDGRFAATRRVVGDATGVKGSVRLKGVVDGSRMSGTVKVHMHNPVFGDCRGKGKFSRAKGELIG